MERTPTTSHNAPKTTPKDRHHGGQEPPDALQDTPEQNAGYDRAVEQGPALPTHDAMEVDDIADESPESLNRE